MVTLFLLHIFTVGAAVAVVKLTPTRDLEPRPATVAGRDLVGSNVAALPAADAEAPVPGAAALSSRLAGLMRPEINAVVIDAATRRVLFDQRGAQAAVPASTTKLVTSTAVLAAVGPDHRLTTKVVQSATGNGIVLVGGGDPTLAGPALTPARLAAAYPRPASIVDLARQTAAVLRQSGRTQVRLDYDASLYEGQRTAPGWKPNYLRDGEAAPVTALMVDEGRVTPGADTAPRVQEPVTTAVQVFRRQLQRFGITVRTGSRVISVKGATQLAAVQSPPVSALVEQLLTTSDNDLAEAMARQVAIKQGLTPDFAGVAKGVHDELLALGVSQGVQTFDGSGLSIKNLITPEALARIVSLAASGGHPELRSVITGMPVAGFSGTLSGRYLGPGTQSAAGLVRAKTGTLSDVTTLAGLAYDADGRLLAFAFMANRVQDVGAIRGSLDQLATAVAGCGC
ncbi:D-alanyl-D-alanine carboxypeptidase/D-alanyl-D-alanine endopeptidase [Actinomadura scrupuli]|uniref:D-alanyl-D-alanine carboxypeptidase/D-alanyl-D-alanine endopeptidase n=1 Tax=Actinomadura scrupuli TaxID=559629 RepID=UPI003D9578CC